MGKKLKIILVMALPYVLIILLPILTNVCLGSMIVSYYHDQIITDKVKSVESAFERFTQRMDNIESLSYILANNKEITRYAYASIRGAEHSIEENMKIRELLNNFLINNDLVTMYIYDPGDNRILTTDAVISNAIHFFKHKYSIEGFTPQESIDRIKRLSWGYAFCPVFDASIDNIQREIIEYSLSIPLDRDSKFQLQLVMVIDAGNIFGDLHDVLDEHSEFYLYDSSGKLIYGKEKMHDDSDEIYQITCYADDNSWRLDVYMNNLVKSANQNTIGPFVWMLIGFSVLISVAFSIYFTYRNHREIEEVLMLFKGHYKIEECGVREQVGYKAIKEYAVYLCKYEVFDKLLRNTYKSKDAIENALRDTNFCIREEKCVVLCIRYEGSGYRSFITEDIAIKDIVSELLTEAIESKNEIFDTAARETICVLTVEDDQSMEIRIRDIISKLNVEIAYSYGIDMRIGVGNIVESVYHINESYMKAKEAIRYSETLGKNVLFYSELAQLEDVYYYPGECDEKMYNYLVAGKSEEAKSIVEKLYRENFEQNSRMLSARAIDVLKSRLGEFLISIAKKYDISTEEIIMQLGLEQSVRDYFEFLYDYINLVSEEIQNKKESLQNHTAVKMMKYIQENYGDSSLSLKQMSMKFGLHETYISRLFKAEYNDNFSGIIEKLRIQKACELILGTDIRIGDIVGKVGYTSDLSFRRAFKKVTGMNPGEYRENKNFGKDGV